MRPATLVTRPELIERAAFEERWRGWLVLLALRDEWHDTDRRSRLTA
jgi:hypothetical protein